MYELPGRFGRHPRALNGSRHTASNPWADYLPLRAAERALLSCAAKGEACDLLARWPDDEDARVIRPALLRALCLRAGAVDPRGITLVGAAFRDRLDLRDTDLSFGLKFSRCAFERGVDVTAATVRYLGFYGCTIRETFNASYLTTEYSLALTNASDGDQRSFVAAGSVYLNGAKVGGQLACNGAKFQHQGERCFFAQGIETGQSLLLRGVEAAGPVDLAGAKVGGQLDCNGAKFQHPGEKCFFAQSIETGQSLLLRGVEAAGPVDLAGAKVGGVLDCEGAKFRFAGGACLSLYGADVTGDVHLTKDFEAAGVVYLSGADLRGSLYCNGGSFWGKGYAIDLEQANVAERFLWHPKEDIDWSVELTNARVGVLDDRHALKPPRSWGERARHWREDRLVEFGCGLYRLKDGRKQGYLLEGFTYERLGRDMPKHGSEIVRWLLLSDQGEYHPQPYEQMARVLREGGNDAEAREVAIAKRIQRRRSYGGFFLWRWLRQSLEFWLLDIPIRYGYRPWVALVFAVAIWGIAAAQLDRAYRENVMVPASHDILPGVVQGRDGALIAPRLEERKDQWRQQVAALPKGTKRPPAPDWEAQERDIAQAVTATPEREKPPLKDFVSPGYPHFNPAIYALDEFLPIIELHQVEYWIPDRSRPGGGWYWGLLWLVCISGWYLSTLFVSAFTGLIKTD